MLSTVLLAACAHGQHTERAHEFTWRSERLGERRHCAIEMVPEHPSGWAVVLIGGGLVTDEDWFVPGSFTDPGTGEQLHFTIDGQPTHDARTIGLDLVGRGYTVWQWSSIHAEDPLHAQGRAMAEPLAFERGVELTAFMVDQMLDTTEGLRGAVLVGHSLGANRSLRVGARDERVVAFVFLAGASIVPLPDVPSSLSLSAMAASGLDANGDGVLDADELAPDALEARDFDSDGVVRGWELAADRAVRDGGWASAIRAQRPEPQLQSLIASGKPALALFGGLDPMTVQGPLLRLRAEQAGAPIEVRMLPGLGHQLSIERDGRFAPIDPGVVEAIGAWLDGQLGDPEADEDLP